MHVLLLWRSWVYIAFIAWGLVLGGCTNLATQRPADVIVQSQNLWEGRLNLVVHAKNKQEGKQSFFTHFVLTGNEHQGRLQLSTLLGTTVADLNWGPDWASLTKGNTTRNFNSTGALLLAVTGQNLPLGAIFNWLQGIKQNIPGWQVDLSQFTKGRLQAQRLSPVPHLTLNIALTDS